MNGFTSRLSPATSDRLHRPIRLARRRRTAMPPARSTAAMKNNEFATPISATTTCAAATSATPRSPEATPQAADRRRHPRSRASARSQRYKHGQLGEHGQLRQLRRQRRYNRRSEPEERFGANATARRTPRSSTSGAGRATPSCNATDDLTVPTNVGSEVDGAIRGYLIDDLGNHEQPSNDDGNFIWNTENLLPTDQNDQSGRLSYASASGVLVQIQFQADDIDAVGDVERPFSAGGGRHGGFPRAPAAAASAAARRGLPPGHPSVGHTPGSGRLAPHRVRRGSPTKASRAGIPPPTTVIAFIALFVSLGGVSDGVATLLHP